MSDKNAKTFIALAELSLEEFSQRHSARERGLAISRKVIRLSANAIRAVHRGEFDTAKELIQQAGEELNQSAAILTTNPEIYHAGFLVDARKEFSEANITLAFIAGEPIPLPADIGVDVSAYLKGLGDVAGELRRHLLDSLRRERFERCEFVMETLDEIYSLLATLDYPEGVTGGLRRTTDMVRGTLERTRGDYTIAVRQRALEERLRLYNGLDASMAGAAASGSSD